MKSTMKSTMESHEVIDNFLPQTEFQKILDYVTGYEMTWIYEKNVVNYNEPVTKEIVEKWENRLEDNQSWRYFYMARLVYGNGVIFLHNPFGHLVPVLKKLNVKSPIRIKCNMYPNLETLYEHNEHIDFEYSHNAAIFSLNTCNGYTKLNDGTKINSVANRMLLFDASKPHCSTNTSDQTARFNININYF